MKASNQILSNPLVDRITRLRRELPMSRILHEFGLQEGKNLCPFHDDAGTPSLHVYPGDGGWYCFGCGAGGKTDGGPAEFVARARGWPVERACDYLEKRYGVGTGPKHSNVFSLLQEAKTRRSRMPNTSVDLIKEATAYVAALTPEKAGELMQRWLITRKDLARWCIGWDDRSKRYTLPVFNMMGRVVDIRYRAEFDTPQKCISVKGCGVGGHLFGAPQLLSMPDAQVVIVGGEKDVIIATHHLGLDSAGQQRIFVTGTLGETPKAWRSRWNQHFDGRTVTICYDNDDTGFAGSREVMKQISLGAKECRLVRWTEDVLECLPKERWRGADLADLLLARKTEQAEKLLQSATVVRRNVHARVKRSLNHA